MDGDLAAAAIAAGGGAPNIGSAIGGSRMTSFTEKGWDYMFASDIVAVWELRTVHVLTSTRSIRSATVLLLFRVNPRYR